MINPNSVPFENWFSRQHAAVNSCFLCGRNFNAGEGTREHIFPQWLLDKFHLRGKTIGLLNQTRFAYNQSVIPCCNICNNEHLSGLERIIKVGLESGYKYFIDQVPKMAIYQWCQLIFYKWLYKETFLRADIRNPASAPIVEETNFSSMTLNHLLLRSIDKNINFEGFFPGSIFICHVKTGTDSFKNFDYLDAVPEQCLMIRLGEIGIVAVLADGNLQEILFKKNFEPYLSRQLAPLQFKNLFAECLYRQHLFSDPFRYEISNISEDSLTIKQQLNEDFKGNVYGEWNSNDYANLMSQIFGGEASEYKVKGGHPSFLFDKNGQFKDRSFEDDGSIDK
ncbi:MAG TPA: hypothetical protein VHA56_00305 [Mucilaginibacter sp.]|nr:hypothetical protein [Mucilaginibacter sp.]